MKALLLLLCGSAFGLSEIQGVSVEGEGLATVRLRCLGCLEKAPAMRLGGNQVELTWADAILSEKHQGKLELSSPHPLISRISVFPSESQSVKAVIVVRGSTDDLERRVQLAHAPTGTTLQLAFPNGTSHALAFLKNEEEAPIKATSPASRSISPRFGTYQIVGIVAVVGLAAFTSLLGARYLRRKGKLSGSRRYLIENLAQVPVDKTASVCLLKVGSELVLVGITGQSVTFLSSLPRLQEQYDSEHRLERRAFQEAVEDEFRRLKTSPLST